MKLLSEVSDDKARGGFYSPEKLVDVCIDKVQELSSDRDRLAILEPGAGDGAFLRALARSDVAGRVELVKAIEIVQGEAEKCREALRDAPFESSVLTGSVIEWGCDTDDFFDVVIGNPPFLRYQFIRPDDKRLLDVLARRLGVSLAGVSNLWVPFLLASLARLRTGGVFAFIIPTECFTGVSAGIFREWIVSNTSELSAELFPHGSFPGVLQEVLVLSGRRTVPSVELTALTMRQHGPDGCSTGWTYSITPSRANWTRYLLTPGQMDALAEAQSLSSISALGSLAKFEVAAVTGANDFFSVDLDTANRYDLRRWARPLLPRARHARGLMYTQADAERTLASGAKALLLDFAAELGPPDGPAVAYLQLGVAQDIPSRYKCRIRDPWYRVPQIRPGTLMLSKRSHRYPRLIINQAAVVTTDTIYRGEMLPLFQSYGPGLTAAFHNSITMLSAELEGRSFGGGVLELVPTEVGRLLVPAPTGFERHLSRLDQISREAADSELAEGLVEETDRLLVQEEIGLSYQLVDRLNSARQSLLRRRLDRN